VNRSRTLGFVIAGSTLFWAAPARADVVTQWNARTMQCVQGGPTAANRGGPPGLLDVAIVQAAVHDAVQAIEGRYEPYLFGSAGQQQAGSVEAAAANAAYRMLVGLYGAGNACLATATDPAVTYGGDPGLQVGADAATMLLTAKRPSFASPIDPFRGGDGPGEWRPTPPASLDAQNAFFIYTQPFTLLRASQFRPDRYPPMVSDRYRREFNEVKTLGSLTGSTRTVDQTDLAMFWTANPISTWFGALRGIAEQYSSGVGDTARLFALAALSAADGQITIYDAKFYYNFWRPVTAIREAHVDGNPHTERDETWTPLVGTPPYPDYTSGANSLAASILTSAQLFFGTDELAFSVTSSVGNLLKNPRPYTRFSDAMQDIVEVRILQGLHFRSADEEGRRQGARVAHWVFQRFLRPVAGSR
jgi:hypothetical protein